MWMRMGKQHKKQLNIVQELSAIKIPQSPNETSEHSLSSINQLRVHVNIMCTGHRISKPHVYRKASKAKTGFPTTKHSPLQQRSWWLLSSNFAQKLSASILVLQKYGLPKDKIETLLLRNPGSLLQSPNWLESTIEKVEPVLGIPRNSPRFADGIELAVSMATSTLETKFEVFRSFGWSDSEIHTMVSALPFCVRRSEAKIEVTLKFFMNELGYTATYLATHPKLLVYSLEKRVMPRYKVLEILKEKKLLKNKLSLCSVVALSESNFVRDFVAPYNEFVPHLYESS
ncbi:hypothetical protein LXL04_035852 [Taraxacum kok-saghyz]